MNVKQDRIIGILGEYYHIFNDGKSARKFDKEYYTSRMFKVLDVDGNSFLAIPVRWHPDRNYFKPSPNADIWRGEIL